MVSSRVRCLLEIRGNLCQQHEEFLHCLRVFISMGTVTSTCFHFIFATGFIRVIHKFLHKNGLSTKIKIRTIQAFWRSSKYFPRLRTISVHRSGSCSNPPPRTSPSVSPSSRRGRPSASLTSAPGRTPLGSGMRGSHTEKCRKSRVGGEFDRSSGRSRRRKNVGTTCSTSFDGGRSLLPIRAGFRRLEMRGGRDGSCEEE